MLLAKAAREEWWACVRSSSCLPRSRHPSRPARPPHVKQVATAVLLILAAFSTPVAWNALSLDPILANPSLILVLTVVELLFSIGTGLSAVQIAVESCVGALIGGGLELGVSYAVYGINGGTHTGPTKVRSWAFGMLWGCRRAAEP